MSRQDLGPTPKGGEEIRVTKVAFGAGHYLATGHILDDAQLAERDVAAQRDGLERLRQTQSAIEESRLGRPLVRRTTCY